ncbi:MAG: formate-dependent phosphoribosylglycinamide formyltransferase, partial [Desulfovibrio sp.]|nr:formate-dependent phosphoribosylglycinamide formyltransferase [Desulfovibrio sp.]
EVIAVDRYPGAPAMQAAHRSHTLDMLNGAALRDLVRRERPDFIVPEIEAIATETLLELEGEGFRVIPTARAARLTMNREGIRRLAAEESGLLTSPYRFAATREEFLRAVRDIGLPAVVKPVMSSSGKGQSLVRSADDLDSAWEYAQKGGRGRGGRVIVEGFVAFDYEITLLTVRHPGGVIFCDPIGHYQEDGDYRLSWQPQPMSPSALAAARGIAETITAALGGHGIFGVELFVRQGQGGDPDLVYFSEVSPRPHDTGLVTCISQNLSEFALHVRAILGLPIPSLRRYGPAASAAVLAYGTGTAPLYQDVDRALAEPDTALALFGKPELAGRRRMGVALALAPTLDEAKAKAKRAAEAVRVQAAP